MWFPRQLEGAGSRRVQCEVVESVGVQTSWPVGCQGSRRSGQPLSGFLYTHIYNMYKYMCTYHAYTHI